MHSRSRYSRIVRRRRVVCNKLQYCRWLMASRMSVPDWRRQPRLALERLFEVEGSILMDASVAGLAAQHIPFLYTVLGEVFDELGPEFRRALHREAALAEKANEDDTHAQMAEIGTEDRLEAVYEMENVALERLQERQERVMLLVEGLGEEDISVLSSNAP